MSECGKPQGSCTGITAASTVYVNNAGRSYAAAVEEIDPALFDEIFHLNVLGPIVAMQAVIPLMRAQGGGSIVNINSGTAFMTVPDQARRFEFTTEGRSYGQALGKTVNLGVISAVFYKERVPTIMPDTSNDSAGRRALAPRLSAPAEQEAAAAAGGDKTADDEYAATGMGRRTGHAVEHVWLNLEDAPVQTVSIRYEFHPLLVRLGILSPPPTADPLPRRERAHGFAPGFCPEPPRQR